MSHPNTQKTVFPPNPPGSYNAWQLYLLDQIKEMYHRKSNKQKSQVVKEK